MNKITTVLFDFDGTLIHHNYDNDEHYWNFLKTLDIHSTPELKLQTKKWTYYYYANSPEIQEDKKNAKALSTSMFYLSNRRVIAQLGNFDEQTIDQLTEKVTYFLDNHLSNDSCLGEDVIETLTWLKPKYKTGLITNRAHPVNEHLDTLNVSQFFDSAYAAGEVGFWKPSPKIFERALAELEITPQEAIYVGDNHFADVAAARDANMTPILLDPEGTFEDPGCTVIHKISDLIPFLKNLA